MNTRHVLLVEDDENDITFMQHAWERVAMSASLHVVTDGVEAMSYLSGSGQYADRSIHPLPLLLLLDLNLPQRNGFEVLKWIRQHAEFRALVVVVLTASSADSDAERAYALGANSYVIKPPNLNGLREFLAALRLYWANWNYVPPVYREEPASVLA